MGMRNVTGLPPDLTLNTSIIEESAPRMDVAAPHNRPSDAFLFTACLLLIIGIFAMDSALPLGVAGGVPYILVVLIAMRASDDRWPIWAAIVCSSLTLLAVYTSPTGGEHWKVLANRGLAVFAIWTVAVLGQQRHRFRKAGDESASSFKILAGLLPICAKCKKIRDDQGYWNQLESFISQYSEAEFSHGICPQCASEYEKELDEMERKSRK
jgi:hypothetical protein